MDMEEKERNFKSSSHQMSGNEDMLENGLTPVAVDGQKLVDTPKLSTDSLKHKSTNPPERRRTMSMSVNSVTQTANGSILKLPKLHIPGETGELAGLNSEMGSQDETDTFSVGEVIIGPDKLKQVYSQIKAKKIKYKLIFATTVITMLMIAYSSVLFPWFLPYYHTVVFPLLFLIRVVVYTQSHWQLFCLDFCYFANLALLVFCWAFPREEAYFGVIFGAVVGPVAIAVLVFRNSVVFHDYDRMTSAYIHLVPNITVYLLKWYPEETSKFWYFSPNSTFAERSMYAGVNHTSPDYLPPVLDASWFWIVAIPLLWFVLHTSLFMLIEGYCFQDKKYLTSYRWLSSSKSSMYRILTLGGKITREMHVKISWLLFNVLYGIISILIARLCFEYQIPHTIYVILMHVLAIYNGASFYIDVFAKRGLGVSND